MAKRPFGVTLLAILGVLVAIGQIGTALRLLGLLPFVQDSAGRSLGDWFGALCYLLIGVLNLWIVRRLWALRPDALGRVVVATVVNGALALLATLSPATFWQSLTAVAINVAFFFYCRSERVRRAFGEPPGSRDAWRRAAP